MRISDWSSDVCSSDLPRRHVFRSVCAIGMAGAKGDVVSPIDIVRIPVLSDNYVWLVHDRASKATMVVDPAVAEPVLEAAAARGWTITDIWNPHWHPDHTGGSAAHKRSDESRLGKEGVRTGSSRWSQYHKNKKKNQK